MGLGRKPLKPVPATLSPHRGPSFGPLIERCQLHRPQEKSTTLQLAAGYQTDLDRMNLGRPLCGTLLFVASALIQLEPAHPE
jgi:hypothetical protein